VAAQISDLCSHSAKYTTALPCMVYSCAKFDFRTLPSELDGQIETKVVGPGELKSGNS